MLANARKVSAFASKQASTQCRAVCVPSDGRLAGAVDLGLKLDRFLPQEN
jgi:hypothetical protein